MKNSLILFLSFILASFSLNADIFSDSVWIGVPGDNLPFYAHYLPEFKIDCDFYLENEKPVSIIYGANDPRLLNRNLNIYNMESPIDSVYIKIELDPKGKINIYRSGYHPSDNRIIPFKQLLTDKIRSGKNHLELTSDLGQTNVFLNDEKAGDVLLNPIGRGGDYIAFPVLGDIGVEIPNSSDSYVENIKISNFREPGNIIYSVPGRFNSSSLIKLPERSMPLLRTSFEIPDYKIVESATAYLTSRGIYDIEVNGSRVNEDYFNPGSTQYNRTHLYQSYDITPLLKSGHNEISTQLGEGWWSGGSTFNGSNWNFFGDRQSILAEINIRFTDGEAFKITSNPESWQYSLDGPVIEGSFFQGEIYDARKTGTGNYLWAPVVEIALDSTVNKSVGNWDSINIRPSYGDHVLAVDTLQAISMTEPRLGVYVYDFGQNMAGVPYLKFSGLDNGQEITMRYAEVLYPHLPQYKNNRGMIMTENLRAAMCRDIYRASGSKEEIFSPRFTLHGFRYIELTGIDNPLPLEAVQALPLSSIQRFRAHYECSDSLVNRLWENIKWSTRSNFISIPTDCPQRNERLGWMGDISVFAPTATKLADISPLLRQYLQSVRDCQNEKGKYPDVAPTGYGFGGLLWGSAGITVPWEMFKQYNDTVTLKEHYPSMKKYINFILTETIDSVTNIIVQDRAWGDLGDWLSPEYEKTDKSLLWECYFIYDLGIMENIAHILGHKEDAEYFHDLKKQRIGFFRDTYIDPVSDKTIFSDFDPARKGDIIDTQISYALPIAMDIYNSPLFTRNFQNTINRMSIADDGNECPPFSLMTGFIGTAWIMEALSRTGNTDYAYRLLTSRNYPSWLYPVTQGATTVWERLNSYTHTDGFGSNNSMNSFNHYSFGSVGNWLLTRSLGINITSDGKIIISPEIDPSGNITHASGWIETDDGMVESSWAHDNGIIRYDITLPHGKTGIFLIPGKTVDLHAGYNSITVPCK